MRRVRHRVEIRLRLGANFYRDITRFAAAGTAAIFLAVNSPNPHQRFVCSHCPR